MKRAVLLVLLCFIMICSACSLTDAGSALDEKLITEYNRTYDESFVRWNMQFEPLLPLNEACKKADAVAMIRIEGIADIYESGGSDTEPPKAGSSLFMATVLKTYRFKDSILPEKIFYSPVSGTPNVFVEDHILPLVGDVFILALVKHSDSGCFKNNFACYYTDINSDNAILQLITEGEKEFLIDRDRSSLFSAELQSKRVTDSETIESIVSQLSKRDPIVFSPEICLGIISGEFMPIYELNTFEDYMEGLS